MINETLSLLIQGKLRTHDFRIYNDRFKKPEINTLDNNKEIKYSQDYIPPLNSLPIKKSVSFAFDYPIKDQGKLYRQNRGKVIKKYKFVDSGIVIDRPYEKNNVNLSDSKDIEVEISKFKNKVNQIHDAKTFSNTKKIVILAWMIRQQKELNLVHFIML